MFKNLEIWVTDRCDSHCVMCHAWRSENIREELSPTAFGSILRKTAFREVESVQVSGGEPTMRDDLSSLMTAVVDSLPSLRKVTLTTNGLRSDSIAEVFKSVSRSRPIEYRLCVSLDGDPETNMRQRGVDSHDLVIETLVAARRVFPPLRTMILMTITSLSGKADTIRYVDTIAKKTGSEFSFRVAYDSRPHHHADIAAVALSEVQKKFLIRYIKEEYPDNDFFQAQRIFLETGRIPMMEGCQAGRRFANIRADGRIFPCINSSRPIGDIGQGIAEFDLNDLGTHEPCPCCDEACYYPMREWRRSK